jgi:hypothetical protein
MRGHLYTEKGNITSNNNDNQGGLITGEKGRIGLKGTHTHKK